MSTKDSGISVRCYNNSIVNLYGVTFGNTTASDEAHLLLSRSTELTGSNVTTTGQSNCTITGGTGIAGTANTPGIIARGHSYVSFSSSTASALLSANPIVSIHDFAAFAVVQNGIISGTITAFDHSRVIMNDTNSAGALGKDIIESYNFSSVSIFNCTLSASPFPIQLTLFGSSNFSLVDSTVTYGYITLFDNTSLYIASSVLTGCRIVSQGNASLKVADGSIIADSIEMTGDTRLGVESSVTSLIYCEDASYGSFVNSSVSSLSVSSISKVQARSSTLHELSLIESNVYGSFVGLTGFLRNSTFSLAGSSFEVGVINTTVNYASFLFLGHSNVTFSNSTIHNLSLQGSSVVKLNNTLIYGSVSVFDSARVLAFSILRVRCVDYFGNALNGSVVAIQTNYAGKTIVLQQRTANKSGFANFILFSEMDNATGSFPLGVVDLKGNFGGVSTSQYVSVTSVGKNVTLTFSLPSWSIYILPVVILVVIVALLTLIYYALKRIRGNKQ